MLENTDVLKWSIAVRDAVARLLLRVAGIGGNAALDPSFGGIGIESR